MLPIHTTSFLLSFYVMWLSVSNVVWLLYDVYSPPPHPPPPPQQFYTLAYYV